MAKKPAITTIASGYYSRQALNSNFENLQTGFDNTLSLDGSTPNAMGADLDMNSNDILNAQTVNAEALRLDGVLVSSSSLAASGATLFSTDHTGDGTTVAYNTTYQAFIKDNTQVYIDGVYQNKAGYSISGTTLTFSEAPPLNAAIEIVVARSLDVAGTDAANVGYNQGNTGSVLTTVEAKLQETVSVKDFGAVGDGVTDDTAAIQAATLYSSANAKSLYFPSGTYIFSSTLDWSSQQLNIIGEGFSQTVLQFNGSGNAINGFQSNSSFEKFRLNAGTGSHTNGWYADFDAIGGGGRQNVRFQEIYIDGFDNDPSYYGLYLAECWKLTFDRVRVSYCSNGIYAGKSGGPVNDTTFNSCDIARNFGTGLRLGRGSSNRVYGGNYSGAADVTVTGTIGIELADSNQSTTINGPYLENLHTGIKLTATRSSSINGIFFNGFPAPDSTAIHLLAGRECDIKSVFLQNGNVVLLAGDGAGSDPIGTSVGLLRNFIGGTVYQDTTIGGSLFFANSNSGTTANRPSPASATQTYYNTTASKLEVYDGSSWMGFGEQETGSWTPAVYGDVTAGTYTLSGVNAYYVKTGDEITVHATFGFSAASGGAGTLIIGGLPVVYQANSSFVGSIMASNLNMATAGASLSVSNASAVSSTNTLAINETADSAALAQTQIGNVTTSTVLQLSVTYKGV